MELTFLGTAASEGFPDAFCGCDNCRMAREAGGPSLRKRSAALIDGELLIDMGPDLMAASQIHNAPLDRLRYCIQTHEHNDHLDPSHFHSRSPHCGVTTAPLLEYYASQPALAKLAEALDRRTPGGTLADPEVENKLNLRVHQIAPGQRFTAGPYTIISVPAAHVPEAMLFVIEHGGRRLFYGTDTGPLPEAAYSVLASIERPLHVVVLDHTFGFTKRSGGHLNADLFIEQIERMRALELLDGDTRVFAHHLGHHSHPPHEQFVALAAAHGYAVAYDGLRVAI